MKRKNNKLNRTLILLIVLLIVLSVAYIVITFCFANKATNCVEQVLLMCGNVISFIGTMVLGIVAFWQTKESNTISKLIIEQETEIDINWLSPVIFESEKLNIKNIVNFSQQHPMEGVICVEKNSNEDNEVFFLEINFPFELKNGSIESLTVTSVGFNNTMTDNNDLRIALKVLNKSPIIVAYNPDAQKYFLKFCINCDFEKLKLINSKEIFVLDFTLLVSSKYGTETKYTIQANFEQIMGLENLLFFCNSHNEIKLKNFLIKKERYNAR